MLLERTFGFQMKTSERVPLRVPSDIRIFLEPDLLKQFSVYEGNQ